tara:strand:+ start:88 stop:468 length:381 start_codon:yes stop_codon:yes gene_type:complete
MQAAYLNQLSENYKDTGLKVLGVNINSPKIINQVRPWANKRKINFDISLDPDSRLAESFKVTGLPTTFLVDKNGKVLNQFRGYVDGYEDNYRDAIEKHLDSQNIIYKNFEFEKQDKEKKSFIEIDF